MIKTIYNENTIDYITVDLAIYQRVEELGMCITFRYTIHKSGLLTESSYL